MLFLFGLFLQLGLSREALTRGWAAARSSERLRGLGALLLGALAGAVQVALLLALLTGFPDLFG